jgi:hypothetical protein
MRTNFGHEFHTAKQEKNVHIYMCPEALNLWVTAERILSRPIHLFSINMWAVIAGDCLVCPNVLPHRLTGQHYRDFLLHDLPKLLEDVPLAVRAPVWHMRDGAPAHFILAMLDVLNNISHDRWIGTG